MKTTIQLSVASIVTTTLLGAAAVADAGDLACGLAELRAELALLKSQSSSAWLTDERASEIKSLVAEVLADSTTRTSLQGAGATSGYNHGFFIASADGNFRLNANFLVQARFTFNHQNANPDGAFPQESSNLWDFENRRTAMAFTGNIVDPSWTYAARFNYGSNIDPYTPIENAMVLQDAWVAKEFDGGFSVKVGQFKSPFMAESLRDDGAQLTAERSVVDYIFSGGYCQGIAASYSSDQIRASAALDDGPRSQPAGYVSEGSNKISLAGRFEFKAMGSWSQFDSESSARGDESALMIGAAAQYYNNRETGAGGWYPAVVSPIYGYGDSNTTNAIDWTVDATFKSNGFNASVAFIGASYGRQLGFHGTPSYRTSFAFVGQAGYRFVDALEAFGRWEWMDVENAATSPGGTAARNVNNILTFGVNVYAAARVKWTTQFGISLSEVGDRIDLAGAGYRLDNNTDAKDQYNIITQLQLSF